jgi:integrase
MRTISKAKRRLTAAIIQDQPPGLHHDGGGLYLQVTRSADGGLARSWVYRYMIAGVSRAMGLGKYGPDDVTAEMARREVRFLRQQIAKRIDPLTFRQAQERAIRDNIEAERKAATFGTVADEWYAEHSKNWGEIHRGQVRSNLDRYCKDIWSRPIKDLRSPDIAEVMRPVYATTKVTGPRLLNNIEKIFETAIATERYDGENPAKSVGVLFANRHKVKHHEAIPIKEMPEFAAKLRATDGVSARALELAMLTVLRTDKYRTLKFDHIDTATATWTVERDPDHDGKHERSLKYEFKVPLCDRAVEIIEQMRAIRTSDFVFPGDGKDGMIGENALSRVLEKISPETTVHGLRSSFRDWAGEMTDYDDKLVEYAMMHTVGDKVERAYRRGNAFNKRKQLMADWSAYVSKPVGEQALNVRKLRA